MGMDSPQAYAPNPSLGVGACNSGIGAQYAILSTCAPISNTFKCHSGDRAQIVN